VDPGPVAMVAAGEQSHNRGFNEPLAVSGSRQEEGVEMESPLLVRLFHRPLLLRLRLHLLGEAHLRELRMNPGEGIHHHGLLQELHLVGIEEMLLLPEASLNVLGRRKSFLAVARIRFDGLAFSFPAPLGLLVLIMAESTIVTVQASSPGKKTAPLAVAG